MRYLARKMLIEHGESKFSSLRVCKIIYVLFRYCSVKYSQKSKNANNCTEMKQKKDETKQFNEREQIRLRNDETKPTHE